MASATATLPLAAQYRRGRPFVAPPPPAWSTARILPRGPSVGVATQRPRPAPFPGPRPHPFTAPFPPGAAPPAGVVDGAGDVRLSAGRLRRSRAVLRSGQCRRARPRPARGAGRRPDRPRPRLPDDRRPADPGRGGGADHPARGRARTALGL